MNQCFQEEGFLVFPKLLTDSVLDAARAGVKKLLSREYEGDLKPFDRRKDDHDADRDLVKIDQPHLANRALYEVMTDPKIGECIAQALGASRVQLWAAQLIVKPSVMEGGGVGWHQDFQYWKNTWTPDSELFTVWLALSEVDEDCGPVCFLKSSHKWGFVDSGDYFGDAQTTRKQIEDKAKGEVDEVSASMPAGAFSLHDRLTFHGSYANTSGRPRLSIAMHLRSEKSTFLESKSGAPSSPSVYDYRAHIDDLRYAPVLYAES